MHHRRWNGGLRIANRLSSEEIEAIAMSEAAINTAWDKIEAFMRDAGQRRKYEQREKYEHDYVSDMEGSWKEGVMHVALNMLRAQTPIAVIKKMTEMPESAILKLAKDHGLSIQG